MTTNIHMEHTWEETHAVPSSVQTLSIFLFIQHVRHCSTRSHEPLFDPAAGEADWCFLSLHPIPPNKKWISVSRESRELHPIPPLDWCVNKQTTRESVITRAAPKSACVLYPARQASRRTAPLPRASEGHRRRRRWGRAINAPKVGI